MAISGILTFNGWRGLIELPFMIVSVPANAILSLGKVLTGNGPRLTGNGGGGGQPPGAGLGGEAGLAPASVAPGAAGGGSSAPPSGQSWLQSVRSRFGGSRAGPPSTHTRGAADPRSGRGRGSLGSLGSRDSPPQTSPPNSDVEPSVQESGIASRKRRAGGGSVAPSFSPTGFDSVAQTVGSILAP